MATKPKRRVTNPYKEGLMKFVPYQLCPKCEGTGSMKSPTTQQGHASITLVITCDVCHGNKIIPMCPIE